MSNPKCPYCGKTADKVKGDVIYPHRPDLHQKRFYLCEPCFAYVGCHGRTGKPLGTLANVGLREARRSAHATFDPFWKNDKQSGARSKWYKRLAEEMGIPVDKCHIGQFDVNQCDGVIEACDRLRSKQVTTRSG